jgi:hypothetical protein
MQNTAGDLCGGIGQQRTPPPPPPPPRRRSSRGASQYHTSQLYLSSQQVHTCTGTRLPISLNLFFKHEATVLFWRPSAAAAQEIIH